MVDCVVPLEEKEEYLEKIKYLEELVVDLSRDMDMVNCRVKELEYEVLVLSERERV